jgi:uncharacterized protein YndB with AHSA1/START domain
VTHVTDSIQRDITIEAGLDTVWRLVSEPGWWVGEPDAEPVREAGAVTMRRSEQWGSYPVRVEEMRPQTYAAFRWASLFRDRDLTDTNSTLVEFWLTETAGGVHVKVVESGFEALDATPEQIAQGVKDNSGGWPEQLERLCRESEAATV